MNNLNKFVNYRKNDKKNLIMHLTFFREFYYNIMEISLKMFSEPDVTKIFLKKPAVLHNSIDRGGGGLPVFLEEFHFCKMCNF